MVFNQIAQAEPQSSIRANLNSATLNPINFVHIMAVVYLDTMTFYQMIYTSDEHLPFRTILGYERTMFWLFLV